MADTSSIYYVYVHRDADENVILVGKGKNDRVTKPNGRPSGWKDKFHSYQILKDEMSEIDALRLERDLIAHYKSCHLLNVTKAHKAIDLDFFKEYVEYSEDSPTCLIWKKCTTRGKGALTGKIGGQAGCVYSKGKKSHDKHCIIGLSGRKNVLVHRLIWALHFGQENMDISIIDHIDGNPLNNKISNLQLTTASINQKNRRPIHHNSTKNCGISWLKKEQGYRVRFTLNSGKSITKWFTTIKYSKEQALSLAIAWKIENKELLIANGYSERYIYGNT